VLHEPLPEAESSADDNTMASPMLGEHPPNLRRYLHVEAPAAPYRGLDYITFIKYVAESTAATSYVEIGTESGAALRQVSCDALCIDPKFQINGNVLRDRRRTFFYQMTSDEFFSQEHLETIFSKGIDLAFIDGLHHFEMLLRDFIHVERY